MWLDVPDWLRQRGFSCTALFGLHRRLRERRSEGSQDAARCAYAIRSPADADKSIVQSVNRQFRFAQSPA